MREGSLLERVYREQGLSIRKSLKTEHMVQLLEAYVIYWLLRADADSALALLANRTLLEQSIPHWEQVSAFVAGRVLEIEYMRRTAPKPALDEKLSRRGHNALVSQFSFDDAHRIVGGITKSFASFWDSECASMKVALFNMDSHRTGRVPLSRFYTNGLEADWRFGESEAYLRELGALDETGWRGKQVIISNYMQAASNCVISTPHYLVCCTSDCETLLDDIEMAVGTPKADPTRLFEVVSSMPAQSTLDDDFPPPLVSSLPRQLEQIAAAHGGEVPLHGRLFAQWLHYAFPRECAFPHKAGVAAAVTPSEYGEDFYASPEEMKKHAADLNVSIIPASIKKEELQWMSQWSQEEELIADHVTALQAPWEQHRGSTVGFAALLSVTALGVATLARVGLPRCARKAASDLGLSHKGHFV